MEGGDLMAKFQIGFDEILKALKPGELVDSFIDESGTGHLAIVDSHGHVKRLFIRKGDKFAELNAQAMIDTIAEYLKDELNVKAFLTDVISNQFAVDIMDLFLRIHKKKPKIKQKKGCYNLLIYGRRGTPFKLRLRE